MRRFTAEEMKVLSKYEDNLRRAYKSDWCRNMMRSEIDEIYNIYKSATGSNMYMRHGCGACLLQLLKSVGRLYFGQLVEITDVPAENKKNVKVKTRKKESKNE